MAQSRRQIPLLIFLIDYLKWVMKPNQTNIKCQCMMLIQSLALDYVLKEVLAFHHVTDLLAK